MPSSFRVPSVAIVALFLVPSIALASQESQEAAPVVLTGRDLAVDDVVRVARGLVPVRAEAAALLREARAHHLLLLAAERGLPIYGLNRGVGIDRDKQIFRAGELDPAARRASERFNRNLLLAHSEGIGPDAPVEHVRAALLARVNAMLYGATGAQPAVAQMYLEFLNRRIHPVLPSRGSIGEADIDILAHVGLAMLGEGDVIYQGRRVRAGDALREAGLVPLAPFAKDGLSILSSNAYAAGIAALLVHDTRRLLDAGEVVAALSLEGLNGNVSPLLEPVQALRPYPEQAAAAQRMREVLHGSYLWRPDPGRALQDPLSFRTTSQVYGGAREQLQALERAVSIQLNSSDDNPGIVDNLYYIVGMELLHAAQAVDLRRRTTPTLQLGQGTARLYAALRRVVPFLDRDRAQTDDMRKSYELLRAP